MTYERVLWNAVIQGNIEYVYFNYLLFYHVFFYGGEYADGILLVDCFMFFNQFRLEEC